MARAEGRTNWIQRYASQPAASAPGTPPSSTDYTPAGPAYQAGLDRIYKKGFNLITNTPRAVAPGDTISAYDINGLAICTNNLYWHRHLYTDYYQISTYTGPAPPNCWYDPSPPDNVQYPLGQTWQRADQTTTYGTTFLDNSVPVQNSFTGVSPGVKIEASHMNNLRLDVFNWAVHKHQLQDQNNPP